MPGIRTFLGSVLLIAAVKKLTVIDTTLHGLDVGVEVFADIIARGGLVPSSLAFETAVAVIAVEIALGFALYSHIKPRLWATITLAVLLVMTIYLFMLQLNGKSANCGCFGQWDGSIPLSIFRNFALMIVCTMPVLYENQTG